MRRLGREFYERHTLEVAPQLLGKLLIRRLGGRELVGRIVEVEAYRGRGDPASHASRGRTPRNEVMFREGGLAYVYFTYGNHYLLNATTEPLGRPGAVLIRAIEPLKGIDYMMRNRGTRELRLLTSGPGRLTQALRIDRRLNGVDLTVSEELFIADDGYIVDRIARSPRIGVSGGTRRKWRFYIEGNEFVSKMRSKKN